MNVLILANHLNYGGISRYILSLCKAWHTEPSLRIYVASRGGDLQEELRLLGIKHIRLPLTTKCETSPKVFLSFLKLLKLARRSKIDVIHANTRVTQVLAALLSVFTARPVVSTCHGYFKRRLTRRLFPCWGDKVIAISDQVRGHLIDDFHLEAERIELIYNGVDAGEFHPYKEADIKEEKRRLGLDPSKKIIGHIGRLSIVKGQRFLISAALELSQRRKDVQFLIIGDGGRKKALRELIRQKRLEDVVFIRPSVKDTAPALSVMDVFVMPSLEEGLGISILEAQAQGIPVVASRVGGIPMVVADNETGLTFEVGDIPSMVSAIERFLRDSPFKEQVVRKARAQVEKKFSLSAMAQATYKVYRSFVC